LGDRIELSGVAGGRHVADELDVPAERQPRDFPARSLSVSPAEQLAPEADRENLRRYPQQTCDKIMPELVEEDEHRDRAREGHENEPKWGLGNHLLGTARFHHGAGPAPRHAIYLQYIADCTRRIECDSSKCLLDQRCNLPEWDFAVKERGNRDFVGGIKNNRRGSACLERLASETERRKALQVRRFEVETAESRKIEFLRGRRDPLRPC